MSHPAICIAVQGTTRHVRPRYTGPGSPYVPFMCAPAVPGSHGAVFQDPPYAIRISEFGNPKSETVVQEIFMVRYFPS
jgi:hypothetical protein